MTRILLVDDQTLICEILQTRLEAERDFQVVGYANNGQKAIQQVEALRPDVILMDIEMPGMNGLTAVEIIKDRFPQTRIIVLSGNEDADLLVKALKAGAQGYLVKTNKAEDLANTIRSVGRGHNQIEPKLLEIVAELPVIKDIKNIDVEIESTNESKTISNPVEETSHSTIEQKTLVRNGILEDKTIIAELEDLSSHEVDRSLNAKPVRSKLIWSTATVLILSSLVLLSGKLNPGLLLGSSNASDGASNLTKSSKVTPGGALPVETVTVTPVDSYQESRLYTGKIVPRRTSELGFEYSGKIIRIAVFEGDRVAAGIPLAYLDSRELKASLNELQAQRSQAVAKLEEMQAGPRSETISAARAKVRDLNEQLELASLKSQRRKSLYTEGAISREQLDENVSNQQGVRARLDEAQSRLDELLAGTRSEQIEAQQSSVRQIDASIAKLKIQLEKRVLKAPFSAIVSRKLVDEGTVVDANQPVMRLVENKALEARIGVPVNTSDRIAIGSYQQLEIGEKTYEAKVTSLLPEVDSDTRTVTVVLTLDESIEEVTPGQTAKLKLNAEVDTSGYWLPTTALLEGGRGLWYCYALGKPADDVTTDENSVFYVARRDVEVLYTQSDRVLVRGTINAGDRIISSGTHRIVVGQLVTPIVQRATNRAETPRRPKAQGNAPLPKGEQ